MLNAKQLLNQTAKGLCENTVKFLKTPILKKICTQLLLNLPYKVTGCNFLPGSHLKPSRLSNITKIPVDFKQNL